MKNTPSDGGFGIALPREIQRQRIQRVIQEELSPIQREVLLAYYIEKNSIPKIALDRGVNKSSVCRALRRAEAKLKHYLKY